ncbi:YraN family protein [Thioalkalivibrio sp. XN8]|mgnify:CR=1 FL=1|uniref:YraN family protein n=1 Tax=Thioalkalivibrio sp. XN8 TaxID=2712863 RepID=UPI0013ED5F36|nr:YraN family protein [Thioalkalivibrio sp. XN8]
MSRARGTDAEAAALRYLERRGLRLLARNYHCRLGEIDLVMQDDSTLVFVEVRARADARHGGAAASVGPHKQRRLALAARHYLMTHPRAAALPARFDVVAISGPAGENEPEWIRAAFDCAG